MFHVEHLWLVLRITGYPDGCPYPSKPPTARTHQGSRADCGSPVPDTGGPERFGAPCCVFVSKSPRRVVKEPPSDPSAATTASGEVVVQFRAEVASSRPTPVPSGWPRRRGRTGSVCAMPPRTWLAGDRRCHPSACRARTQNCLTAGDTCWSRSAEGDRRLDRGSRAAVSSSRCTSHQRPVFGVRRGRTPPCDAGPPTAGRSTAADGAGEVAHEMWACGRVGGAWRSSIAAVGGGGQGAERRAQTGPQRAEGGVPWAHRGQGAEGDRRSESGLPTPAVEDIPGLARLARLPPRQNRRHCDALQPRGPGTGAVPGHHGDQRRSIQPAANRQITPPTGRGRRGSWVSRQAAGSRGTQIVESGPPSRRMPTRVGRRSSSPPRSALYASCPSALYVPTRTTWARAGGASHPVDSMSHRCSRPEIAGVALGRRPWSAGPTAVRAPTMTDSARSSAPCRQRVSLAAIDVPLHRPRGTRRSPTESTFWAAVHTLVMRQRQAVTRVVRRAVPRSPA